MYSDRAADVCERFLRVLVNDEPSKFVPRQMASVLATLFDAAQFETLPVEGSLAVTNDATPSAPATLPNAVLFSEPVIRATLGYLAERLFFSSSSAFS